MPDNTLATRLRTWVADLDPAAVPPDAVEAAKLLILDQLGLQLAGATSPAVQPELRLVTALGAAPEATVAHSGVRTAASYAAFANATLADSSEFDDVHTLAGHLGSPVVPTALAFGEAVRAPGREVLTAVVAGAQVMSLLGARSIVPMVVRGRPGSKILGTFGAPARPQRPLDG
ncbi:MmgE/PrpD family protein [Amycolatopsis sp. NPDC051903]|uniref:MmgE/PrpD family protein n=1 Tax=Amycolatopsis sp. NPDC051903 TaxID=3363936 RepID=UPI00378D3C6A